VVLLAVADEVTVTEPTITLLPVGHL